MRVHVLHNAVGSGAGPDERDVLAQVEAVTSALAAAGHEPVSVACDLDLESLRRRLARDRPDAVFNLVESLGGFDRLIFVVPALLDALGVPYTGSPTAALLRATDKLATKGALAAAGLPVPPCLAVWPAGDGAVAVPADGPFLVKSVWDHGSPELDDGSVFAAATPPLEALAAAAATQSGPLFAEPYVAGREINVALLTGGGGLEVLPPAEIVFDGYPPGKPRIVGFRAKWDATSFEFHHTPRSFDFPPGDRALLARLAELSRTAFEALGLEGYGRVDFRVADDGRPWILEVNANPCLSPDAGFAAAAGAAGLDLGEVVLRVLDAALAGVRRPALALP